MIGLLVWDNTGKRRRRKAAQEVAVMRMRLLRIGVARGERTPEAVLCRRVYAAEKRLKKLGVSQVILPEGFSAAEHPAGITPVSTLPLRQALAADWVRREVAARGLRAADTRVAVSAQRLTGEVVRTVTELSLRHRYVLLEVPYGGEELCRRLRREYGVSLLLNPEPAELEAAEVLVLFDEREARKNVVVLPLYDEKSPLPPLVLPPALEEKLPVGADRAQLLAALLQSGMIRAGADLTF